MIIEIEKPTESVMPALDYNENKVLLGVAEVVGYANLECVDYDYVHDVFSRMQKTPYFIRQMSFHASVNPSAEDKCTQEQVLDFITLMMETLGYKDQPYLIYKHFDIEREHYHIVSIRADKNGRKINNYYEQKKTTALMQRVCENYDFSVVPKGYRKSLTDDGKKTDNKKIRRLDLKKELTPQIRDILIKTMMYDFRDSEQFACVLERYGVGIEEHSSQSGKSYTFYALDKDGERASNAIPEFSIGLKIQDMLDEQVSVNKTYHPVRKRERERLKSLIDSAFKYSKSEQHFINILENKGITAHMHCANEGELPYGITFVDHLTKSVFKENELGGVISAQKIGEAYATGRWYDTPASNRSRNNAAFKKEARSDAIAMRNAQVSTIARLLKPMGQPEGNSWKGKTPKSKDQKEEERLADKTGALNASLEDKSYTERIN